MVAASIVIFDVEVRKVVVVARRFGNTNFAFNLAQFTIAIDYVLDCTAR
jgi:hypothetical protein